MADQAVNWKSSKVLVSGHPPAARPRTARPVNCRT